MTPPPLLASADKVPQMYFVYLLRSLKTGKHYLGWTTDLDRRLCQHNEGESQSTKDRGPYEVVYFEAYRHKEEAMGRERVLKTNPNMLLQIKKRLFVTTKLASSRPKEVVG